MDITPENRMPTPYIPVAKALAGKLRRTSRPRTGDRRMLVVVAVLSNSFEEHNAKVVLVWDGQRFNVEDTTIEPTASEARVG